MRAYQNLTIAAAGGAAPGYVNNAAGVIAAGATLNLDQIKTLSRHAGTGFFAGYGALTDPIIFGIGAAGVGVNNDVSVT